MDTLTQTAAARSSISATTDSLLTAAADVETAVREREALGLEHTYQHALTTLQSTSLASPTD